MQRVCASSYLTLVAAMHCWIDVEIWERAMFVNPRSIAVKRTMRRKFWTGGGRRGERWEEGREVGGRKEVGSAVG